MLALMGVLMFCSVGCFTPAALDYATTQREREGEVYPAQGVYVGEDLSVTILLTLDNGYGTRVCAMTLDPDTFQRQIDWAMGPRRTVGPEIGTLSDPGEGCSVLAGKWLSGGATRAEVEAAVGLAVR